MILQPRIDSTTDFATTDFTDLHGFVFLYLIISVNLCNLWFRGSVVPWFQSLQPRIIFRGRAAPTMKIEIALPLD